MEVNMLQANMPAAQSYEYPGAEKSAEKGAEAKNAEKSSNNTQSARIDEKRSDASDPSKDPSRADADKEWNSTISALEATMREANKKLSDTNHELRYSVHEKTKQIAIKILNSDTKEIVREIPPEKTLDAIARMWELAGLIVDKRS